MIGVEGSGLFEVHPRRGEVVVGQVLLALARELLHEWSGFHLVARLLVEDARVVVHQVVGEDLGGQVDGPLEVARGQGPTGLAHGVRRTGHRRRRPERVDVDGKLRIARLVEQFLGGIEHRVHTQDQPAAGDDFLCPTLLIERQSLLERR